jgi:tRNA(adenine34) deaminase
MRLAIGEARRAGLAGEVPVGAVLVVDGKVIARGRNKKERKSAPDPTAHAEIVALRAASRKLGRWRLTDATLYVTKEPCPMCAGAIVNARLGRLVYGCADMKGGAAGSLYNIPADRRLNHRVQTVSGVLAEETRLLLKAFFKKKRS